MPTLEEELDLFGLPEGAKRFVKSYILSLIENMKQKPESHTHNSIPNYTDEVDEGCSMCIRNQALADQEAKIAEELKRRGI
jgi:hypothetical protein